LKAPNLLIISFFKKIEHCLQSVEEKELDENDEKHSIFARLLPDWLIINGWLICVIRFAGPFLRRIENTQESL
jgi:hypothetical protein